MALFATILGIGYGCNFASTPNLVVEAVSAEEQSAGASMLAFAQNMGAGVVPVLITLVYNQNVFFTDPKTGVSIPTNQGIGLVIGIGVVGSLVALAFTLLMKHGRQPASGGAHPDRVLLGR
jgi:MFS family permease